MFLCRGPLRKFRGNLAFENRFPGCTSIQVWEESYRDRLVIRPKTQHAKCGQCVKYKLLLKRLVSNPVAKRSQMAAFRQHLRQQYHDRTMYWRSRSLSRMGGLGEDMTRTISICLDSIDHSKFPLPKSTAMGSKCFAGYIKPSLTVTGVLLHGLAAFLVVGEPHLQKDSCWTAEILAYCMHVLCGLPWLDVSRCHIRCHGDNSSRELKNNCITRLLAGMVSSGRVRSACLETLQSGHSHEDIDQWFSSLSTFVTNEQELHTTEEYLNALQKFLDQPHNRPHEHVKRVIHIDQVRNWIFGWYLTVFSYFIADTFFKHQINIWFLFPNQPISFLVSRVWPFLGGITLRRDHLQLLCFNNKLVGIGGPGAPHLYHFSQFQHSGLNSTLQTVINTAT